jgi:hypothetical protein
MKDIICIVMLRNSPAIADVNKPDRAHLRSPPDS